LKVTVLPSISGGKEETEYRSQSGRQDVGVGSDVENGTAGVGVGVQGERGVGVFSGPSAQPDDCLATRGK
jgi:hypothetical protein